jgi:uncharacterized protein
MATLYRRPVYDVIAKRVLEPRRFIQVLAGPRQVGKTTLARQVIAGCEARAHYVSADEPTVQDRNWLAQQWEVARSMTRSGSSDAVLFVIDEIQKISGWSETIKRLWDEDSASGLLVKVLILGSSPLLVQKGLTESLAGRFEVLAVAHWSYDEMRAAFGMGLDEYIYFGGYPGAAGLIHDQARWASYIKESLIETTISRDILLLNRVDKPALLRRMFYLACEYSGQTLSYQKMTGQLQDAGNTTTLAHYLELLKGAGLAAGLPKYAGQKVRQRGSSPKLMVYNTALVSAVSGISFEQARRDGRLWGRLVESAIGAHLMNSARSKDVGVFYWLGNGREVDFVLARGNSVTAIEVKSGRPRDAAGGMEAFCRAFKVNRQLLVGTGGIPVDEFLATPVEKWV